MDKPVNKTKKSQKPYFSDKYKQRKQGGAIAPYVPPGYFSLNYLILSTWKVKEDPYLRVKSYKFTTFVRPSCIVLFCKKKDIL